jgi:Domain of unknown function (DUF4965)/Domain of unknown function (DUF1793)/Domain of unknown function (DUF5127)/Domain of unknown function (DUF4964)
MDSGLFPRNPVGASSLANDTTSLPDPAKRSSSTKECFALSNMAIREAYSQQEKAWIDGFGTNRVKLINLLCAFSILTFTTLLQVHPVLAQQLAPAVPLISQSPYFSIWSFSDTLTGSNTKHWTGSDQKLAGLVRVDGKLYRYMGAEPRNLPGMRQASLKISPMHTDYSFEEAGVRLDVSFFTPAFPRNLEALSRPVSYLAWTVSSVDGHDHSVDVLLAVSPNIAVNSADQEVTWGRARGSKIEILRLGSRDQQILHRAGDDLRIDWGYFYLAVPEADGATTVTASDSIATFVDAGSLPSDDDMDMPRQPRDGAAHLAVSVAFEVSASHSVTRHVLLAYDEIYSVEYFGRKLRPYWRRDGQTLAAMLRAADAQYADLEKRGRSFDDELTGDLDRIAGKAYSELGVLAYRQTLAAHGFAADLDGTPLLFPKENFSNGCISTVDVIYPAAPFFLVFNPSLLEAQLKEILEYASMPRWRFPFAPHDLGTYPLANGQVYGGGERTEEDQMPVEESGNMLILVAGVERAKGDFHLAEKFWPVLTKWAEYLRTKGLDPENQLSTDDFAGHLAHNANLSIKAIEALAAYGQLAQGLDQSGIARQYEIIAKGMASQWQTMAMDGDHYRLAFDKPGTWSQKYNLVWDRLLDLQLFPSKIYETEMAFYVRQLNNYGLPLDNRADYTKLDWEIWTVTLTNDRLQVDSLLAPLGKWLHETPSRVPLTDWYDTKNGKQMGFQARSVVGGVFIKLLGNRNLAAKWRNFNP